MPRTIPKTWEQFNLALSRLDKLQEKIGNTTDPLKVKKLREQEAGLKAQIKKMSRSVSMEF